MKSKKNLTRFTYETAAFEGWRLCISRAGSTFTRYFPDKKLGGPKKSLAVAEKALAEVKAIIEGNGRAEEGLGELETMSNLVTAAGYDASLNPGWILVPYAISRTTPFTQS